ncbi:MAG: restriction endonuclease subunit S [Selenomonadaceae bacterium]|nr:restriction endonuclease subunit S [Selenomonadaceae bacterium]
MRSKVCVTDLQHICKNEKGAIISGPFGSNISKKYFVEKGVPVIRGNNLPLGLEKFSDEGFVFITEKKADELRCDAFQDDLIFTAAGTIGQVGIIPQDAGFIRYVISNKQLRARIDSSKVLPLFAYYWFAAPWSTKVINDNNKGSTVPLINLDVLKSLPIIYPISIREQEKIANLLECITQKIKTNTKVINTLEYMAKTIYDYWFVQFDFPDANGRPYKTSGGKMEWNENLSREIPAGWEVKPLSALFMDERNGEWGTDKVTNTNTMKVTCIRGADFPAANGYGALEAPLRFVGIQKSDRIVKNGDLIIEISGGSPTQSTGRVCYINQKLLDRISTPVTTSNFCKIVSTIDINYFYFAYMTWLRLYESDIFFNFEGKTTGLKNLLFDVTTKSIKIPIPRKELLQKYQQISETYFSQIQELADENSRLTALRDFLLPMLMNGQVTFRQ